MIRFSSNAAATITMFDKDALQLIKLMDMSGKVPSAVHAEDIPNALDSLNKALSDYTDTEDENGDESNDENVSENTRAYPLIQMLKKAHEENESVMWDYE